MSWELRARVCPCALRNAESHTCGGGLLVDRTQFQDATCEAYMSAGPVLPLIDTGRCKPRSHYGL